MWTQSDLGLHCLLEMLLKRFSSRQQQTTFVVIGVLRVKMLEIFLLRKLVWMNNENQV